MAITVAVTLDGPTQSDGRRYVRETYSEGGQPVQFQDYLASVGADTNAIATARLPFVTNDLADKEAFDTVQVNVAPTLRFQTGSQFLDRVRAFYRRATDIQLAKLARWITARIQAGDVTVLQLRTAFGLSVAQWNTLQAKMEALRDHWNAVEAGVGE